MSDEPGNGDGGRTAACRACGNRVARAARRCPACGAREPANPQAAPPPEEREAAPAPSAGSWRLIAALVGAALVGAVASAAVFVLRPAPPSLGERMPAPVSPVVSPATPEPASAVSAPPPAPEPSRSRGRADWLFFFRVGDQLVRMGEGTALGMVIRTIPGHAFGDGTVGPAYLLQLPDGAGQRVVDADELERSGRLH
jgi:hypothetical protein